MVLSGKEASESFYKKLHSRITNLKTKPTLAAILIGDNPASQTYLRIKSKKLEELGLGFKLVQLDENISQEKVLSEIENLNSANDIHGIIVQLPLPKHLDERIILEHVSILKDVDCLTSKNLGVFFSGNNEIFPATAKGVIRMLEHYNLEIEGKNICVIGRSNLVTKPLAVELINRGATVTVCHSKTKDLKTETLKADIVISGIGKAEFLTKEYFKNDQTLIDIGTSIGNDGKLKGDFDYKNISNFVENITPVPGGVGPMTVYGLIENLIVLSENAS